MCNTLSVEDLTIYLYASLMFRFSEILINIQLFLLNIKSIITIYDENKNPVYIIIVSELTLLIRIDSSEYVICYFYITLAFLNENMTLKRNRTISNIWYLVSTSHNAYAAEYNAFKTPSIENISCLYIKINKWYTF